MALDNLVDLIDRCITHPAAADQVFLAGDAEDLSTTQLLRAVGLSLGKPARLLPVPVNFMEMIGALMGRRAIVQKICGNLQVDISKARKLLGWIPPLSTEDGLRQIAKGRGNNETGV